jgi:hypothetical protein
MFNFAGTFCGGITSMGAGLMKSTIGLDGAFRWSGSILILAALLLLGPIRRRVGAAVRPR